MSKIITFANQKGGTGKTTLSVLTAHTLSSYPFNHTVTVVDCDEQQSISRSRLMDLEDTKEPIPYDVKTWNIPTLQNRIQELDDSNDFVIIDLAGRMGKDIETILAYVDVCIIPITAGNYTLESSLLFLEYVSNLSKKRKEPIKIIGTLNKYQGNRTNSKFLRSEALAINNVYQVPFLKSKLKNLVAYEDIDTIKSIYNENAASTTGINFKVWFDELYKMLLSD